MNTLPSEIVREIIKYLPLCQYLETRTVFRDHPETIIQDLYKTRVRFSDDIMVLKHLQDIGAHKRLYRFSSVTYEIGLVISGVAYQLIHDRIETDPEHIKLLEISISKNSYYSSHYAYWVKRGIFVEGERSIASDPYNAGIYTQKFKKELPFAEKRAYSNPEYAEKYVATRYRDDSITEQSHIYSKYISDKKNDQIIARNRYGIKARGELVNKKITDTIDDTKKFAKDLVWISKHI
jgi:hypothetical protein